MDNRFGFKIAKEGKYLISRDPRDFVYDSDKVSLNFRRDVSGTDVITIAANNDGFTIPHGYSYSPAYIMYKKEVAEDLWRIDKGNTLTYTTPINLVHAGSGNLAGDRFRYYILNQPLLPGTTPEGLEIETGRIGMLISRDGVDVSDAKAHELTLNSEFGSFLKYTTIDIEVTHPGTPAGATEVSVENPLGYACAHFVQIEDHLGNVYPNVFFTVGGGGTLVYDVGVNAEVITARVVQEPVGTPITIKFKITLCTEDLENTV